MNGTWKYAGRCASCKREMTATLTISASTEQVDVVPAAVIGINCGCKPNQSIVMTRRSG